MLFLRWGGLWGHGDGGVHSAEMWWRVLKPSYCSEYCQKAVHFLSHCPIYVVRLPCGTGGAIDRMFQN